MSDDLTLILASGSRYRAELLSRLELPFETRPADIDETRRPDEPAPQLVQRLAREKVRAVPVDGPALVIGSDQVAVLDDEILGKPGTRENAIAQLARQSGREVSFLTAVCLLDPAKKTEQLELETVRVRFRTLDDAEIQRYVTREQPLDCAGSFKSEALGITLCERIECRDPTALVGLPLIRLAAMLRRAGFELP